MKKIMLSIVSVITGCYAYAQNSNPWPVSGNVGIGTASPAANLHLLKTTEQLRSAYDASNYTSFTTTLNGSLNIGLSSANATNALSFDFLNTSAPPFTTSPQIRLFKNTTTTGTCSFAVYLGDGSSNAQDYFAANGASYLNAQFGNLTVGWVGGGVSKVSVKGNLAIGSTYYTSAAPTDGLLVQGNVGIGTTTPSMTLNVDPQGQGGILIGNSNTGSGSFTGLQLSISAMQNGYSQIQSIQSSGSAYGNLFLNPVAGHVGIGTTDTQGYLFAVAGPAIATSMTVKLQANWPDYVFQKDYCLPSLTEVKTYIDQNQHLPEMPSEKQVAKDGLNLGEMNKLLVKKVEELTLYLIEADKKDTEQTALLKSQQDQINQLRMQVDDLIKASKK